MTKADLIDEIVSRKKVKREDAIQVIEEAMSIIKGQVIEGDNVYLRGFGTFRPKVRKEKAARNISTGAVVVIPERSIPSFIPAREFKDQVIKSSTINA